MGHWVVWRRLHTGNPALWARDRHLACSSRYIKPSLIIVLWGRFPVGVFNLGTRRRCLDLRKTPRSTLPVRSTESRRLNSYLARPSPIPSPSAPFSILYAPTTMRQQQRTPRVIECYADRFAVVGGRRYMIGHPCDWAVSVCTPKDEGSVEAVPLDSELMEELLPGLQVRCAVLCSSTTAPSTNRNIGQRVVRPRLQPQPCCCRYLIMFCVEG